jgi:predicted Zn-dependent protease
MSSAFAFSIEKERELGEKVALQIEKQMEVVRAPSIQSYIDGLGKRILSSSDWSAFSIRFNVLNQSGPNAFAIPGGRIYVTTGLIRLVETEGELAGVMSHEIAHVVRRHIAERIEASKRINVATLAGLLAGILVGGSEGGALATGSLAMGESRKLKYTRENESEADRLGLVYMTRAGYDGEGMVSFLQKITRTPEYSSSFPSYLSTHPGVPTRISYVKTLMSNTAGAHSPETPSHELHYAQLRARIIEDGPLRALEHFQTRLEAQPEDRDALFGKALAEKEMGRIRESIEDLKKAHSLSPTDTHVLKELGLVFVRLGRFKEGIRALERSLALSKEDGEAYYYLGQGYQAQKKLDLAIESYLKADALGLNLLELDRDLASAHRDRGEIGLFHFYYGRYFKKKTEVKYALFHFEKALELLDQEAREYDEAVRELEESKNLERRESRSKRDGGE